MSFPTLVDSFFLLFLIRWKGNHYSADGLLLVAKHFSHDCILRRICVTITLCSSYQPPYHLHIFHEWRFTIQQFKPLLVLYLPGHIHYKVSALKVLKYVWREACRKKVETTFFLSWKLCTCIIIQTHVYTLALSCSIHSIPKLTMSVVWVMTVMYQKKLVLCYIKVTCMELWNLTIIRLFVQGKQRGGRTQEQHDTFFFLLSGLLFIWEFTWFVASLMKRSLSEGKMWCDVVVGVSSLQNKAISKYPLYLLVCSKHTRMILHNRRKPQTDRQGESKHACHERHGLILFVSPMNYSPPFPVECVDHLDVHRLLHYLSSCVSNCCPSLWFLSSVLGLAFFCPTSNVQPVRTRNHLAQWRFVENFIWVNKLCVFLDVWGRKKYIISYDLLCMNIQNNNCLVN